MYMLCNIPISNWVPFKFGKSLEQNSLENKLFLFNFNIDDVIHAVFVCLTYNINIRFIFFRRKGPN